jgi:peptide/nickel transport system substrate-binding protein
MNKSLTRGFSLLALVAFLFVGGCGGRRTEQAAGYKDEIAPPAEPLIQDFSTVGRHGGRFVIGQTNDPRTFNGMMANETSSTDITNLIDAFLVRFDNGTQEFVPELAKSWEVSPDGIRWTFHLRRGAAFSDGHPITAEDVLFTFQVVYDEKLHPSAQDLVKADGKNFEVSAPDSHTVVINTIKPNSMLLDALCQGSLSIIPKHALEGAYKDGSFASAFNVGTPVDKIVGGGPFRVAQYVPGEKTVLGRNPHYYGYDKNNQRLPYLDELVFLIVPDQDAADMKFRSAELDGLDNIKPENYQWYQDNQQRGNFTFYDLGPALSSNFLWFNLNKVQPPLPGAKVPPGKRVGDSFVDPVKYAWFNNPVFRRAVAMAVDRDAMIPSIFFGSAEKSWSLASRGNKRWYVPDLPHYDYNPTEAKRLLASLGYRDGNGDGVLEDTHGNAMTFSVKTNADNTIRVAMANFIKDDLAKVGIRLILNPIDFNTLITNLRADFQYDAILLGLQSGVPPSPASGQNFWRSSGGTHNFFMRQQKPATPEEARIDKLLDDILMSQDASTQYAHYKEMQTILNQQSWLIWLPILKVKLPVSNRFGNVQPSIMAHRLLWNADRLYVKRRES